MSGIIIYVFLIRHLHDHSIIIRDGFDWTLPYRPRPEIMLRLFDEKSNREKICYLRDDWYVRFLTFNLVLLKYICSKHVSAYMKCNISWC